MVKKIVEASMAVALGVQLCRPAVIPMYPITPQTHIVERLADFIDDGELDSEIIYAESEHSAIAAAVGSQATGVRSFTATASQGLALMHEILHIASGMRLPIVMAVANRALSAPISIWNDHQDSMSARDTGWMQFYVESAQEALDTVIMAYKIAEKTNVLLPAMVCLDGFTLSHVYESVDIPSQPKVNAFLPKYKAAYAFLDSKKPMTQGPIGFPSEFMELKYEQQKAMENALSVIKSVNSEFKKQFGRSYGNGLVETYKTNDADYALLCLGTVAGTTRVVVDELRKQGKKVGLIKLKSFRPFPRDELRNVTKNLKGLGVIDKAVSFGNEGPVYSEVKSALLNFNKKIKISGFIAGLGGRDITPNHIKKAYSRIGKTVKTEWLF